MCYNEVINILYGCGECPKQNLSIKYISMKTKTKIKISLVAGLMLAIVSIIVYHNFNKWLENTFFPANAQISYKAPELIIDNRTTKEHVFDIMRNESNISFNDIIKGMAMIERCENPNWRRFAYNHNSATAGCPYGSTDWGIWQINDCYQLKNFENKDDLIECATDVYCATRYAIKLYRDWDNSWNAWSCN